MAFASQQTVQVLASPEELSMLESAFTEDTSNHMCKCYSLNVNVLQNLTP